MAVKAKLDADLAALARLDRAALREAVRRRREDNREAGGARARSNQPSLLSGLLLDENGERLVPSYAFKDGVRYRCSISQTLIEGTASPVRTAWRLPASEIERIVLRAIRDLLSDRRQMMELNGAHDTVPERIKMPLAETACHAAACDHDFEAAAPLALLRRIVVWVKVHPDRIEIAWRPADLAALLANSKLKGWMPSGWTETLLVRIALEERDWETRLATADEMDGEYGDDRTRS